MLTTIGLHKETKLRLASLKQESEMHRRNNEELLIEGCKVMAKESLRICKEFEEIEEWPEWK